MVTTLNKVLYTAEASTNATRGNIEVTVNVAS